MTGSPQHPEFDFERAHDARGADLRFFLETMPQTARVAGEMPHLAEGLAACGVELRPDGPVDVVFATPDRAAASARTGAAPVVVAVGARGRAVLGRGGLAASIRRVITLPTAESMEVAFDPRSRRAAAYAVQRWEARGSLAGKVKQRAASLALRAGCFPPITSDIVVLGEGRAAPAAITAAVLDGSVPRGVEWFAAFDPGPARKRVVFALFRPRETIPFAVLKIGRSTDSASSFDRDEAGFAVAAEAPAIVAERAPRLLGNRLDVGGLPAAVETAAVGTSLSKILRGGDRRRASAVVDDVARWTTEVAAASVRRGPDGIPLVTEHGDLADGNVVVGDRDFALVDWELASNDGRPLGDLLYFALCTLPLLDGAVSVQEQVRAAVALFEGRSSRSPQLFRWIADAASAAGLSDDEVVRLAQAHWTHRVELLARLRRDHGSADAAHTVELLLPEWTTRSTLGSGWWPPR